MDTLVISDESNILHICNKGYTVDYTIYNCKGHSLDGGVLESSKGKFDNKAIIKEIIEIVKDGFDFSEPFTYLNNSQAEGLLELIEMEDYKNTQSKVDNYISTIKNDSYNEMEK